MQRRIQEFAMGEADPGFQFGGGIWRARYREPITSEGRALSGVQGQSPWSGVQGAKHPEAESI